jgi:curved DNA-binding protein
MSMEDFGFAAEEPAAQRGADIEGGLLVTLVEALHGATRQVSVQRTDPRTGQVTTQTYRVRIPAGVHEGQLIRLAGRGHEGTAGAGDLFLRVKFARHPDYRVRDGDLYHDLPLAPWEAVLGTQVTVPTPDGAVRLTVPAGTKNGQQFRLRGRGLPKPSSTRGDLYVIANIEVPTDVRSAERELWEKLRAQSSFQPRG